MKKYTLSLLTLSVALSSGAAFAGEGFGDTQAANAEIVFAATSSIAHTITPVSDLRAGSIATGTTLANGTITLEGTLAKAVAVTFKNGEQYGVYRRISGVINGNYISVGLTATNGSGQTIDNGLALGGANWQTEQDTFTYAIKFQPSAAYGNVNADVYAVQLDAQRWVQ